MRARNIKPGLFKNEFLAECDPLARILFTGLWCMADKDGFLEYRPKRLKIEVLPYDECDIEKLLDQLGAARFIKIWCYNNAPSNGNEKKPAYIEVVNFSKHQNPHKNEKPGNIKEIVDNHVITGEIEELHDKHSATRADLLIPDLLIPEKHSSSCDEVDGVDFLLTKKKRKLSGKRFESFKEFWDAFNYKRSKREAADAWYEIPSLTDDLVQKILSAAKTEARNRPALIKNKKTPKMAQGWISGFRWEDEVQPITECKTPDYF